VAVETSRKPDPGESWPDTCLPVENVSLGKPSYSSLFNFFSPDLLEIPDLQWDKQPTSFVSDKGKNTLGYAPWYLRDGDGLFFRDNTAVLKQLSKEEHDALVKENQKRRASQESSYYSYGGGKEQALKIRGDDDE